jgi:hypothetical protein
MAWIGILSFHGLGQMTSFDNEEVNWELAQDFPRIPVVPEENSSWFFCWSFPYYLLLVVPRMVTRKAMITTITTVTIRMVQITMKRMDLTNVLSAMMIPVCGCSILTASLSMIGSFTWSYLTRIGLPSE